MLTICLFHNKEEFTDNSLYFQFLIVHLYQQNINKIKKLVIMKGSELKVGSVIQYLNGRQEWVTETVTRASLTFIWYKGSGYARIKRSTFDKYPCLFKIISL